MVIVGGGVKVAVTAVSALIVNVHVDALPALAQAPPQPVNDEPDTGDADSTTDVPSTKEPFALLHAGPHEIEAGT